MFSAPPEQAPSTQHFVIPPFPERSTKEQSESSQVTGGPLRQMVDEFAERSILPQIRLARWTTEILGEPRDDSCLTRVCLECPRASPLWPCLEDKANHRCQQVESCIRNCKRD